MARTIGLGVTVKAKGGDAKEIKALKKENTELKRENEALKAEIAELKKPE